MTKEEQKVINICWTEENETLKYSAEELGKYLGKMAEDKLCIRLSMQRYNGNMEDNYIWTGLFQDFNITSMGEGNPKFDDEVYIDISRGKGIIAGINPRSVLLGVYRFLTEAGCIWVRPGKDGEYIPEKNIFDVSVNLHEKASYRHRGICIEGANSYENIADIIDWAPKAGFNAYFFQFREAYTFFERWYSHKNNPFKEPEPFNIGMAREFIKKAEKEMEKRDLLYHAVGHGWTCEPFGIPGLSWDNAQYDIKPEIKQYLAEVNGKRELWGGIPLNTNLCYSNPEVRNIIINDIVQYLEKNPQIDVLHFWLADGSNNQCECESCRKMLPSDFYVMMLNDLDELLTERGIDTKVVFLIYVDLLWAPEIEKIKNPDRFILMFAPITRTYSMPFETDEELPEPPPYKRNQLSFPSDVKENMAFLKSWEKVFKGDSFDFDYHFMWDHYLDPGYYKIAELLSKDIKNLKRIGLNGFVSCQVQRAFFPTGLGMYVMGRTLWDDTLDFNEIAERYFVCAFGRDGKKCLEYMAKLSELFDPPYLRGERDIVNKDAAERFSSICTYVDEFRKVIEANINTENACHATSWKYLRYHSDLCCLLAVTLEAKASAKQEKALALWKLVETYVQEHEDPIQKVFDVFEFILTLKRRINRK
ncbi:MAG: DUF4838 domain-containing protein [Firmicutes bacterium]|nr:DUF4838 domain-containing protein [Bacillota bacterium]